MKVMKDLEAHATAAIDEFNRKNHDQELGAFRCEARSDDAFAIVRELDSRHCGQVVVSLNGAKGSVFVLYQPGGLEQQDTFDLQAQPDGDLYIFHGGHRMNVDEITERIVSRFILALEH